MFDNIKKIFNFRYDSLEEKIRDIVLIFLLFIWFTSPSNKLIVFYFIVLLGTLTYLIKKFDISLLITFFLSSFFSVGKKYFVQLIDLAHFPDLIQLYPIGLATQIQISVSDVILALLVIYPAILYNRKKIKFDKFALVDIFLIIFFLYGIFSDIFVSNNLMLSFFLKKDLFKFIFMYFFVRFVIKEQTLFFRSAASVLVSLVMFEVFVSLQQFIYSSPIGRVLEATKEIESFGQSLDELFFVFRPIGTFIHANLFALFLASVLPVFFYLMKRSKDLSLKVVFFLITTCLILTLSRSAWFAVLIGFIMIVFHFGYHKKIVLVQNLSLKKTFLLMLLIIPLFIYSYPRIIKISNIFEDGSGLNLRVRQAREVVGLIVQSPLLGTGKGMSVVKAMERYPEGVFASFPSEIHNYFFLLAVENGLPYLGLFLFFMYLSFKRLINYKTNLSYISLVGLTIMMIIAFFQPYVSNQILFLLLSLNYDKIKLTSYDN